MQIGELFILRINIHLNGSVLDTPELFWVEPQLEPIYRAVRSYLEMDQRVGLLTERLDVIADLLAVLKDQLSHGHGEKLEWISKFFLPPPSCCGGLCCFCGLCCVLFPRFLTPGASYCTHCGRDPSRGRKHCGRFICSIDNTPTGWAVCHPWASTVRSKTGYSYDATVP